MKFIVDMNLSPNWLTTLNDAGFAAAHWSTLGAASAPDVEIMSFAAANGFVVLTHDLDFGAILAATNGFGPSVVQIRSMDVSPGAIGPKVIAGLRQMSVELGTGALLTIEPERTRIRLLPLNIVTRSKQ
jgi:predicted nuclease of predicted toxin-antitoxin system